MSDAPNLRPSPRGRPRSHRTALGFTLVELVGVILILGVLSALALPRLLNLGREARIAKVEAMAGAVRSAAAIGHSAWLLRGGNDFDQVALVLDDGQTLLTWRGWQEAGNCCVNSSGARPPGIETLVVYDGFDVAYVNNDGTHFRVPRASDPQTCSVTYLEAAAPGDRYTLTMQTAGC